MHSIRRAKPDGAIKDLKDLIAKGIKVSQAKFILKEVFDVDDVEK
jgi:hypothetical protein